MASLPQSMPGAGGGGEGPSPVPGQAADGAPSTGGNGTGAGAGAQPNPALKAALGQLTNMAQVARQYAQAYPQCTPEMRQIGELLQKCLMKTTQAQQGQEQPTPPV